MADTTARIRLALEGANAVKQGLASVEGQLGSLRGSVAGLAGGLSAAGFATWIKGAIDAADETGKMAQKTGLLTKEVAGLQLAFDQAGAGDKLQTTLTRLAKEAASGSDAFKKMGINVAENDGKLKSTRVLLGEVSDKFAVMGGSTEKTALAQELFGKTGADLIPVLNGGAQGLKDYDDKAKALGLTLDEETTKAAEQFNDQVDILMQRSQGVARQIAAELLPVLTAVSAEFAKGAEQGGSMSAAGAALSTVIETVSVLGANAAYVFKQIGNEIGGMAAQAVALATLDLSGFKSIGAAMRADAAAARDDIDAYTRRVLSARKINESLKGASDLDEPAVKRAKLALVLADEKAKKDAADALRRRQIEEEKRRLAALSGQRAATKGLTDAEKELAEIRKQDLAVGVLRNKQAEENYKAAQQAAEVEAQFRQIVIDKEMDWQQDADDEKLKASREILERQQKETEEFWSSVDSTAHDVFVSVATEGEDAFKRIGKTLKAAILDMLYQMTIKKWIFQISGVGGAGGGGSWIDMATQAYQAYSGGGGGGLAGLFGGGTAAAGGASAYGTSYAAGSVSSSAMVSTGASATAGSASTSMMAYFGYAAMIAAAVMVAENLYEKGYNRAAVGYGDSATVKFGQNTSYTADNSMGRSTVYDTSFERMKSNMLEGLGMSEKWVDILSGTTRMATLFGRKLGAYGYEASVAGGDAEVSGFARYKGGVFRGNKTVKADVDPRDAASFDAIVESTIEGARAMARAMGYSDEAINKYTGTLRVNFKGATTAEEQAKRMGEAMDNLNFELLKTASGGKIAREEFKAMMEGVQKSIEQAGISTEGIAGILASGIVDGASAAQIGEQLSTMILGGIYNTMAQNAFGPVAAAISAQLITPIFTAMAAGVPISQVISKQAIANIVATAQAAAAALDAVFANAEFQAAMAGISSAISGVAGAAASVRVPTFRAPTINAGPSAADEAARERAQLEMELLRLQGNTVEIRRRELLEIKPGNRALQQRIWALEDEQKAAEEAAAAAEKLKDTWSSVMDSMADEMKRLREEILGTTEEGRAYALAEFAMATGQARAGDAAAAERLPDLARALVDIASETAGSLSDLRAVQGSTLASLAETQRILGTTYGIELPKFAVGTNYVPRDMVAMIHEGEAIVPKAFNPAAGGGSQAELVAEIRGLRADIKAATGLNVGQLAALGRVEQLLDGVTNGGTVMRTREVAL